MIDTHTTTSGENIQRHSPAVSWRFLVCIATLTLIVRVTYMILFESWNFRSDWAFGHEMGRMGQWLSQGQGFTLDGSSPTAKFPPAYPLFVGAIFYIFGAYTNTAAVALFLFQSLCSALIAVCLTTLGNRLLGRTTGMIAGLAWAFYPTSIFYSAVRVWYSELAVLLVLLAITIAVSSAVPTFGRIALLGALSGLTILTDSTMVLYLPVLLLWLLLARRVQLSKMLVSLAIWGITAGVVMSPWMIRNWLVLGSPNPLKSNLGMEIFFGNNPGTESWREIRREFSALHQVDPRRNRGDSEVAFTRYLRSKALEWIRENPSEFASSSAGRVWQFWVFNPRVGSETWLRLAYFGPVLLLALYGLRYGIARNWKLAPIWLFLFVYPMPYYVTHVDRGRYSYPVEPLVLLLAIITLAIWFKSTFGVQKKLVVESGEEPRFEVRGSTFDAKTG